MPEIKCLSACRNAASFEGGATERIDQRLQRGTPEGASRHTSAGEAYIARGGNHVRRPAPRGGGDSFASRVPLGHVGDLVGADKIMMEPVQRLSWSQYMAQGNAGGGPLGGGALSLTATLSRRIVAASQRTPAAGTWSGTPVAEHAGAATMRKGHPISNCWAQPTR